MSGAGLAFALLVASFITQQNCSRYTSSIQSKSQNSGNGGSYGGQVPLSPRAHCISDSGGPLGEEIEVLVVPFNEDLKVASFSPPRPDPNSPFDRSKLTEVVHLDQNDDDHFVFSWNGSVLTVNKNSLTAQLEMAGQVFSMTCQ